MSSLFVTCKSANGLRIDTPPVDSIDLRKRKKKLNSYGFLFLTLLFFSSIIYPFLLYFPNLDFVFSRFFFLMLSTFDIFSYLDIFLCCVCGLVKYTLFSRITIWTNLSFTLQDPLPHTWRRSINQLLNRQSKRCQRSSSSWKMLLEPSSRIGTNTRTRFVSE